MLVEKSGNKSNVFMKCRKHNFIGSSQCMVSEGEEVTLKLFQYKLDTRVLFVTFSIFIFNLY